MFSKTRLLVGTDFSPTSDIALKAAEILRRKSNGHMHVVHVMQHAGGLSYIPDSARAELVRSFDALLSEQIRRCEVECSFELLSGKAHRALNEFIKLKKPDVLVLGHFGGEHDQFHPGGLTTKMVASADVPVLVIGRPLVTNKIAGLVDPQGPMQSVISAAEECAWLFSGKLEFISVWQDISAQVSRWSPLFTSGHVSYTQEERDKIFNHIKLVIKGMIKEDPNTTIRPVITQERKMPEGIVKVLEGAEVDLAIMCRHQKGIIEKAMIGSTSKRVLESFPGNMLILPPPMGKETF